MNMVRQLKEVVGRRIWLSENRKNLRRPVVAGFSDARTIGVLYDADKKENYELVRNFVRRWISEQKVVRSLGFINSRKFPPDKFVKLGMDFFTLEHVNWYLRPQSKATEAFIKEPFDLLLNFCTSEALPLDFLAGQSRARFKMARFSEENTRIYDFMIQLKPENGMAELIQQSEHYLRTLNQHKT